MTANTLPGFTPQDHAGVTPRKKDKRWRVQFRFWVNANDPDDYAMGELLASLKAKRKFTETIKAGVRLITDLRAGRVDSLVAMFPWIVDAFAPKPGDEYERLLREIADLKAETRQQFEQLALPLDGPASPDEPRSQTITAQNPAIPGAEKLKKAEILASNALRSPQSDAPPASGRAGPKPLNAPQFAAPEPEIDDDDTLLLAVKVDADAGRQAAKNFVNSMNSLLHST